MIAGAVVSEAIIPAHRVVLLFNVIIFNQFFLLFPACSPELIWVKMAKHLLRFKHDIFFFPS